MNVAGKVLWTVFALLAAFIVVWSLILLDSEPIAVFTVNISCVIAFVVGILAANRQIEIRERALSNEHRPQMMLKVLNMLPSAVGTVVFCLIIWLVGLHGPGLFTLLGFIFGPFIFDMNAMLLVEKLRMKPIFSE